MSNADVAGVLVDLANLLEIQGANPFRVRAHRNGARTVETLAEPIAALVEDPERSPEELPGIGKDLAGKIESIVLTGRLSQLEELREQVPAGVVAMLSIPGLGPKKVGVLFKDLGLESLDALEAAATEGAVAELKGFGKKTEEAILEGLPLARQGSTRTWLATARGAVDRIVEDLRQLESVSQASVAGSSRRLKETVGDLDVLATVAAEDSATEVMDALAAHELVEEVLARGETKQRVRLVERGGGGLEMDLRVVPEESYGAAMQYFTGSKEHNIVVRRRAQERGLKVNEYGVFDADGSAVAGRTEEDVYAAVGLSWIPPELREDRGEFERADTGNLPELVTLADIRGDLHMHTTATDGRASIEEMIDAARERKRKYIAITDHSKRVTMANGLDAKRLRAHWKAIDKIRDKVSGIEVLCGIECDILEDASLDLPDEVLAEADWVVAVLHYGLKQPREQIDRRLLAAVSNPHVDVIGHPSGRIIGKRPGADISFPDLFKAAADHGVMMEINAHPSRLDLDEIHAAAARDHGIPIVISTDAHSTDGMDVMHWGVCQARRAGLEKKHVANAQPWSRFRRRLRNG
ncbi:MAG: DNA polymerase/3'-5' exonuclease PolX [Planctomycetaceae bacterium]|nr:DNA polymerase/3'-5' exonuclease PolX [Planctomycetaceae bacterium]